MNCHSSAKLDKLVAENKKVRITLYNGRTYEGWIEGPYLGIGYILESPDYDVGLSFYKSHVKKIEKLCEDDVED